METTTKNHTVSVFSKPEDPARGPHRAFTLVELLVVITIIGILVALITAAAAGALKRGRQAQIKVEMDQIAQAIESYKNTAGSYPPNCQTDDTTFTTVTEPPSFPLIEQQILADLKRHLKQAFPKHRESDSLLQVICGLPATGSDASDYQRLLADGMSSGEAVVFWLGGFSSDPKYPISGEGGPSYQIQNKSAAGNDELDPISRKWTFPFAVERLEPRNTDNYFEEADDRFIEYTVSINGVEQNRRINFWQYVPPKSEQPYLYFDVSRHEPEVGYDPPAAPSNNATPLDVHAIKKTNESTGATLEIEFANKGKFQILHAGVDDVWGDFEPMSLAHMGGVGDILLYPEGPFTGDVADTIVNFSDSTLEASQP